MKQHILVPVDFSECTDLIVEEAANLAKKSGADITLLHAIELPVPAVKACPMVMISIPPLLRCANALLIVCALMREQPLRLRDFVK